MRRPQFKNILQTSNNGPGTRWPATRRAPAPGEVYDLFSPECVLRTTAQFVSLLHENGYHRIRDTGKLARCQGITDRLLEEVKKEHRSARLPEEREAAGDLLKGYRWYRFNSDHVAARAGAVYRGEVHVSDAMRDVVERVVQRSF